jgi:alginate O-acetyltransferase complex protein AlgI
MITFLISGLWHGAGWTFIAWGAINGIFISINHIWRKYFYKRNYSESILKTLFFWVITFIAINTTMVMFRSESLAIAKKIYYGMLGLNGINYSANSYQNIFIKVAKGVCQSQLSDESTKESFFVIILAFCIISIPPNIYKITSEEFRAKIFNILSPVGAFIAAILFTLCILSLSKPSPFLYFQF